MGKGKIQIASQGKEKKAHTKNRNQNGSGFPNSNTEK